MLNCPAYGQDKKTSFHLQQPYDKESKGKFLFEKEDNEEKKEKPYTKSGRQEDRKWTLSYSVSSCDILQRQSFLVLSNCNSI